MINLEWKELDQLEIEEKVQEVLDYSYNTWMSDKKNIRYFVRAFYIRWDMIAYMYGMEENETEDDKLIQSILKKMIIIWNLRRKGRKCFVM